MKLYVLFDIKAGQLQSIKLSYDIFMHRGQAGHAMSACISCPLSNTALIIILDLKDCGKIYSILTFVWHVSKIKIFLKKNIHLYRGGGAITNGAPFLTLRMNNISFIQI